MWHCAAGSGAASPGLCRARASQVPGCSGPGTRRGIQPSTILTPTSPPKHKAAGRARGASGQVPLLGPRTEGTFPRSVRDTAERGWTWNPGLRGPNPGPMRLELQRAHRDQVVGPKSSSQGGDRHLTHTTLTHTQGFSRLLSCSGSLESSAARQGEHLHCTEGRPRVRGHLPRRETPPEHREARAEHPVFQKGTSGSQSWPLLKGT